VKIHYISDHEILEYDEVKMFTEMGYDVFSNGAYLDPKGHITLKRPGIEGMTHNLEYVEIAVNRPRTDLDSRIIEPFDTFIFMHSPNVLVSNWDRIKHKNVIYRSIGQSVSHIESAFLAPLVLEGLKIVRYSPKEHNIPSFVGETAQIRFYKDPDEYDGWVGDSLVPINFTQSLKGRRSFCRYDEIFPIIEYFNGKVYGPGNEDLGSFNGGQVTFDNHKEILRKARAFIYGGTWPAAYTLSFMEALMTGTPIVAIGKNLAYDNQFENYDYYEADEILFEAGGIVCHSVQQMILETSNLLNDFGYAKEISLRQREIAIKYFGKDKIMGQWKDLLEGNNVN